MKLATQKKKRRAQVDNAGESVPVHAPRSVHALGTTHEEIKGLKREINSDLSSQNFAISPRRADDRLADGRNRLAAVVKRTFEGIWT